MYENIRIGVTLEANNSSNRIVSFLAEDYKTYLNNTFIFG